MGIRDDARRVAERLIVELGIDVRRQEIRDQLRILRLATGFNPDVTIKDIESAIETARVTVSWDDD